MKCSDIIEKLEELAPLSLACDWDNPGLLAGSRGKEVNRILLALDASDEVVEQAVSGGYDMLITHHPLIFKPLKKINDGDFIGRRLLKLIGSGISYYAMHTNFDTAPGCMADLAARRLGLTGCQVLEVCGENQTGPYGIGRVGMLKQEMTLKELGALVKTAFGLPFVTVYGMDTFQNTVQTAAVSPGAGSSVISYAIQSQAQVLITGDIGHHAGIDAIADGLAVIDAGHYGLEHIFMEFMQQYIHGKISRELLADRVPLVFPAAVVV